MGVAVAEAALDRGARVTLWPRTSVSSRPAGRRSSGSSRPTTAGRSCGPHDKAGAAGFDALVMAAAVADFRPAGGDHKLEPGAGLTLGLEPTPDLLAEIGRIVRGLDSEGA